MNLIRCGGILIRFLLVLTLPNSSRRTPPVCFSGLFSIGVPPFCLGGTPNTNQDPTLRWFGLCRRGSSGYMVYGSGLVRKDSPQNAVVNIRSDLIISAITIPIHTLPPAFFFAGCIYSIKTPRTWIPECYLFIFLL